MGRRLQSLASAFTGAVTAAGVTYDFDAGSGRHRRTRLGERAADLARRGLSRLQDASLGLAYRLTGGTTALFRDGRIPSSLLAERVRALVGHIVTHPDAVHVEAADDRTVRLTGAVLAWELQPLREAVSVVPGIGRVVAELAVFESAERVGALLGETAKPTSASDTQAETSTAVRLLLRSVAPARRRRALRSRGPSVEISRTLHVAAPVESVYAALRQPEQLVGVVPPLRALRHREEGATLWTLSDPEGWRVDCSAEVTELQPNRQIAWRSTVDSPVSLWGMLWLEPLEEGQTLLQLYISCRLPPGRTGAALHCLAGSGPRQQLTENLTRLRRHLEAAASPPQSNAALSAWAQPTGGRTH
jgi:uncharacterized membrane protein